MSLYLPVNLAALAKIAANESARFSISNLRVLDQAGIYRVEVTDGRRLAIVQGENTDKEYRPLQEAPNNSTEAFVSATDWKAAFKLADRHTPAIGLAIGDKTLTFASRTQTFQAEQPESRWPAIDEVIPKTPPQLRMRVNAKLLAELLTVAANFAPENGDNAVELHFYGESRLLGVSTHNDSGQFFDGLLVPLSEPTQP